MIIKTALPINETQAETAPAAVVHASLVQRRRGGTRDMQTPYRRVNKNNRTLRPINAPNYTESTESSTTLKRGTAVSLRNRLDSAGPSQHVLAVRKFGNVHREDNKLVPRFSLTFGSVNTFLASDGSMNPASHTSPRLGRDVPLEIPANDARRHQIQTHHHHFVRLQRNHPSRYLSQSAYQRHQGPRLLLHAARPTHPKRLFSPSPPPSHCVAPSTDTRWWVTRTCV
ncbi:hypothetical protein BC830DRAFT_187707 [Chytriomyces sp. MP71]|nr:hypothetical protein BC830DRAFT_187707 [Chytriomyces sp. MP71]